MDLGLKELGVTFLVGAFAILGLDLIVVLFFGRHINAFFQGWFDFKREKALYQRRTLSVASRKIRPNDGESKDQTLKIAIFIGLAFATGMLAEDLSYRYADGIQLNLTRIIPKSRLPVELGNDFGFGGREESRVAAMLNRKENNVTPDWLAIDLARTEAFQLADPIYGEKVGNWAVDPNRCFPDTTSVGNCPSHAEIAESIKRLYYFAKNKVYENRNYYEELKRIETRLEFSRAISLIAFLYFAGSLIALVLFILVRAWRLLMSKLKRRKQVTIGQLFWEMLKYSAVIVILFALCFFSVWGYARESDEFNKRAFGYLSSMRLSDQEQLKHEKEKLMLEQKK